jgi:hypothetical protein
MKRQIVLYGSLLISAIGLFWGFYAFVENNRYQQGREEKSASSKTAKIETNIEWLIRELEAIKADINKNNRNTLEIDRIQSIIEDIQNIINNESGELIYQPYEISKSIGKSKSPDLNITNNVESLLWKFNECRWKWKDLSCEFSVTNNSEKDTKVCVKDGHLIAGNGDEIDGFHVTIGNAKNWDQVCNNIPSFVTINVSMRRQIDDIKYSNLQLLRLSCGSNCQFEIRNLPISQ